MDDGITDPSAVAQLPGGGRVDHHVAEGFKSGRKGVVEVVMNGIDEKPPSFPAKVVVVGNGRQARFRQELCDGHPKRDVHGDRQGIFRNKEINAKMVAELVEFGFEVIS